MSRLALPSVSPTDDAWSTTPAVVPCSKYAVRCTPSWLNAPHRSIAGWRLKHGPPASGHRASLDVFGPDRVMFGGDWPVCLLGVEKYADWANALKTVVQDRSEDQQKKLFHDNAVKFYGL